MKPTGVLTKVNLAIINILGTVATTETRRTGTSIVDQLINTTSAILARVQQSRAVLHLLVTVGAGIPRWTLAAIPLNVVQTCGVVLAQMSHTVVNVDLTAISLKAQWTQTAEASMIHHFACAAILARTAVTGVNLVLAVLAVMTGHTATFIVQDVFLTARRSILAWISVA